MDLGSQPGMAAGPLPPRRTGSKILSVLLVLLLLGAIGGLGYLYWQEMDKSAKLQGQVSEKQAALDKAKSEIAAGKTEASAEYTAEVGKFKLTLPKKYFIAVSIDGPFEGGPVTNLTVGTVNEKGKQTVTMSTLDSVTIVATPQSGTFDSSVKAALEQNGGPAAKKLPGIKIDGIDAEVYETDGLFVNKKILFQKNNIFYNMTAGNTGSSDSAKTTLDEVIKGFKFQS